MPFLLAPTPNSQSAKIDRAIALRLAALEREARQGLKQRQQELKLCSQLAAIERSVPDEEDGGGGGKKKEGKKDRYVYV